MGKFIKQNVQEKEVNKFFKEFKFLRNVGNASKLALAKVMPYANYPKIVKEDAGYAGLFMTKMHVDTFNIVISQILDRHGSDFFDFNDKKVAELVDEILEVPSDRAENEINEVIKEMATKHFERDVIPGEEEGNKKMRFFLHTLTNFCPIKGIKGKEYESVVHPASINKIAEFVETHFENRIENNEENNTLKIALPVKFGENEKCILAKYDKNYGTTKLWLVDEESKVPVEFKHMVDHFYLKRQEKQK